MLRSIIGVLDVDFRGQATDVNIRVAAARGAFRRFELWRAFRDHLVSGLPFRFRAGQLSRDPFWCVSARCKFVGLENPLEKVFIRSVR